MAIPSYKSNRLVTFDDVYKILESENVSYSVNFEIPIYKTSTSFVSGIAGYDYLEFTWADYNADVIYVNIYFDFGQYSPKYNVAYFPWFRDRECLYYKIENVTIGTVDIDEFYIYPDDIPEHEVCFASNKSNYDGSLIINIYEPAYSKFPK